MNQIHRRSLFSLGLASVGTAIAPKWLSRWFASAQDPQDPLRQVADAREKQVQAAIDRARAEHKPLLVFVVPEDIHEQSQRGQWLGAFVTHASELAKMEIALAVPCCAKPSELKKLLGIEVTDTPPMFWVDLPGAGEKARATAVEVEVGELFAVAIEGETREQHQQRMQRHLEKQIVVIGEALTTARNRHGASLAKLAAAGALAMTDKEKLQIEKWLASGSQQPAAELLVRATAMVRHATEDMEEPHRSARLKQLAKAIDSEVVHADYAGSRWMIAGGGCGAEFEHPTAAEKQQSGMIACGMGMVQPLAERFLSFYVQS